MGSEGGDAGGASDDAGPLGTTRKRTRLPREQRRQHLLDVAAALVVERGVDGVTMEGVAERAGVSKGLGYAYFDNSDDLLAALFDREMGALDSQAGEAISTATSIEEALRATLEVWLDAIRDRGALLGGLLQAQAGIKVEGRRRRRLASVYDFWIEAAVRELGVTRPAATTAAVVLMGGATGLIDLWIRGEVRRRDLVDSYVTLAVGGLKALSRAGAGAEHDSPAVAPPAEEAGA